MQLTEPGSPSWKGSQVTNLRIVLATTLYLLLRGRSHSDVQLQTLYAGSELHYLVYKKRALIDP